MKTEDRSVNFDQRTELNICIIPLLLYIHPITQRAIYGNVKHKLLLYIIIFLFNREYFPIMFITGIFLLFTQAEMLCICDI